MNSVRKIIFILVDSICVDLQILFRFIFILLFSINIKYCDLCVHEYENRSIASWYANGYKSQL